MRMKFPFSNRKIHIHFKNNETKETCILDYQIYSHSFAGRWWNVALESGFSEGRFGGINFSGQPFDNEDDVVVTLNALIMKINSFLMINKREDILIHHLVEKKVKQSVLNELHLFFEKYDPDKFFYPIKNTLRMLNFFIHKMESFSDGKINDCGIIDIASLKFENCDFESEDWQLFTMDWIWGQLYLSYTQVGVPTAQAYKNNSIPVPQDHYSAGILLSFVNDSEFDEQNKFNEWALSAGLNPADPKIAAGYIPLGMLMNTPVNNDEKLEFLKNLGKFKSLQKIELVEA
jgi:hypothetical protein